MNHKPLSAIYQETLSANSIPITAFCASNGLGRTTAEVLEGLRSGRRGLHPCPLDVPFQTVCGKVPGELLPPPPELEAYDTRVVRLALMAYEEVESSVIEAIGRWGADRVGLVVGTSTGGIGATEDAFFAWLRSRKVPKSYDFHAHHPFHMVTRVLRRRTGLRGPSYAISTACSSSAKVFSSARRLLRFGNCDAVLVGGVDSLCLTTVRGFHSLGVLSEHGCRPFCAERVGMNVGEGAAFLLLEREGDGLAYLRGVGESDDAFHMSAPDPQGRGAARSMTLALRDAGLEPSDVGLVNAHGTGTQRNDAAESKAILAALGDQIPVVSTKSYTGHMLGAGGATEAIFAISALKDQLIPANLGVEPVDAELGLMLPRRALAAPSLRYVMSNSFAFGGSNISVIIGAES